MPVGTWMAGLDASEPSPRRQKPSMRFLFAAVA